MAGFIKLRRDLPEWLVNDATKLRWYIDLLLLSEEKDGKNTIAGRVKMTMRQLAKRWGVDVKSVSRFIHLLDGSDLVFFYNIERCSMSQKMSQEVSQIYMLWDKGLREQMSQKVSQKVSQENDAKKDDKNNTAKEDGKKSLVGPARKIFEDRYKALFNEFYYWQVKDAVSMGQLLAKIKRSRTMKGMAVDDDSILFAFEKLLEMIDDDFILKNFSVGIINSKYNNIVSSLRAKVRQKGHEG